MPTPSPLRFVFDQAIYRKDDTFTNTAQVTAVLIRSAHTIAPGIFDEAFASKGWTF